MKTITCHPESWAYNNENVATTCKVELPGEDAIAEADAEPKVHIAVENKIINSASRQEFINNLDQIAREVSEEVGYTITITVDD